MHQSATSVLTLRYIFNFFFFAVESSLKLPLKLTIQWNSRSSSLESECIEMFGSSLGSSYKGGLLLLTYPNRSRARSCDLIVLNGNNSSAPFSVSQPPCSIAVGSISRMHVEISAVRSVFLSERRHICTKQPNFDSSYSFCVVGGALMLLCIRDPPSQSIIHTGNF